MIDLADVQAAAGRIAGRVLRTPALPSRRRLAAPPAPHVTLKLDNLQVTGAFKERGAANRLALLSEDETRARRDRHVGRQPRPGGGAACADLLGIAATIVMPNFTPVHQGHPHRRLGRRRWCCTARPWRKPPRTPSIWRGNRQLVFVHPYDDPAVMAGQGTLALELLEDAPDLDALVIPVGGGGLLAGCLVAATALRPGIAVFGVEVEAYAAMAQKLAGRTVSVGGPTIAEGIAVRDIGELPFELVRRRVTDVLVVPERAVEEAIGLLAEGAKTVAEGAGAVGVAALLTFPARASAASASAWRSPAAISTRASCPTCCCATCCATAGCCGCICKFPTGPACWPTSPARSATSGGNIIEVSHQRLFAAASVQAAELEVMVEARDPAHAAEIVEALEQATWCGECSAERKQQLEPQMSGRLLAPQTWKLSPQPQRPFSFGLVKVKPDASASSS